MKLKITHAQMLKLSKGKPFQMTHRQLRGEHDEPTHEVEIGDEHVSRYNKALMKGSGLRQCACDYEETEGGSLKSVGRAIKKGLGKIGKNVSKNVKKNAGAYIEDTLKNEEEFSKERLQSAVNSKLKKAGAGQYVQKLGSQLVDNGYDHDFSQKKSYTDSLMGQGLNGGSINIGKALKKGFNKAVKVSKKAVNKHAGGVVEAVKGVVDKNILKQTLNETANLAIESGLTAVGQPELIPLAQKASQTGLNTGINAVYSHDFNHKRKFGRSLKDGFKEEMADQAMAGGSLSSQSQINQRGLNSMVPLSRLEPTYNGKRKVIREEVVVGEGLHGSGLHGSGLRPSGSGLKGSGRPAKGSQEAKDMMARMRAMRRK